MKLIKVGAGVLNQTPRDWRGNMVNIRKVLRMAANEGVGILCLPEMSITGYGLEDDLFCDDVTHRALSKLKQLTDELSTVPTSYKNMVVCVGLPIRFNNSLYNAIATIVDGELVGFTCKQHLAGDGIHYENRWFKPWPTGVVQSIAIPVFGHAEFPIGDIHFNVGGVKIGYEICEDAWVANRPGTILATKGVDVYLNPSASHFSFGKLETRKNFVVDGSRAFNATYIYSNLVGNESGRAIYDGCALIASGGRLLAQGKRFSYQDATLTTAIVDIDTTRTQSVRTASFQPNLDDYNKGCVTVPFIFPNVYGKPEPMMVESWEKSTLLKNEECTRALGLALMDYMRKSRTKGFVVSLSGGADSALVTYMCSAGIRLGVKELGVAEFVKKFCPHLNRALDKGPISIERLVHELITTAYQPTENSGEVTRTAASEVAKALFVPHFVLNVDDMFKKYSELGKLIKGSELNFKDDDLVLQNLQARVRAPSIWMVANYQDKLLLTTSNMSEAAVGYATMDGDTAGCVSPIAGLPKVYIREFLRWAEKLGPVDLGPLPALSYINNQQPTAELRPKECKQTDEDDLMPYDLLHAIESLTVKNRYSPYEIYCELQKTFDIENDKLVMYIVKFFRLFSRNQWKRERYALSFHMDDHNLDPRTWCRTPILTGGYEEELEELMVFLSKEGKEKYLKK